MPLPTIEQPPRDWSGARVLVRSDLNVPLDGETVSDDTRIRASLPTIRALLDAGAGVAVCSHLGRPKGRRVDELSLAPVAARLGALLSREVELLPDCVGSEVAERARSLGGGELVLLENLRFHAGEEANDPDFAGSLANGYTDYVNDAFGAAHRAHASVVGVAERLPARAGLLLAEEVEHIGRIMANPERPFVAVLGGAKVSDKLPLIEALLERTDRILIGGAMCFTFLVALGDDVGASRHEGPEVQDLARELMRKAATLNCAIQLPADVLVADRFEEGASLEVVPSDAIPDAWMGVDIGPRTAADFSEVIEQAGTVFWNGPMGAFEIAGFEDGTRTIAEALASTEAVTVAGGGDSAAALGAVGVDTGALTHVSTGGGAALEMIEGKVLPGVSVLAQS